MDTTYESVAQTTVGNLYRLPDSLELSGSSDFTDHDNELEVPARHLDGWREAKSEPAVTAM